MRLEIHPWRTPLHAGRTGRRGPPDAHRPHREVEIAGNNYRTGHWLLVTAYWLLATGYWLLATGYFRRNTRPGVASVNLPSRRTGTPFTSTSPTPSASFCGSAYVAVSRTVAGSNTTTSANAPGRSTPRSVILKTVAGRLVIERMANSRGTTHRTRTS